MNWEKTDLVIWVLALSLVVVLVGCSTDTPQDTSVPAAHEGAIRSFASVTWGSDVEDVTEKYGTVESDSVTTETYKSEKQNPGKYLLYTNQKLWGETVDLGFVFHPRKGLIKGLMYFHFERSGDCERVYEKIQSRIQSNFPKVEPRTQKFNQLKVPFCNASLVGKAGWVSHWDSDDSSVNVTEVLGTHKEARNRIVVIYETSAYYDWIHSEPSWLETFFSRIFRLLDYLLPF